MKLIVMLTFVMYFVDFGYAEMKVSDFWNPNGSSKILWRDMSEEQKAQDYEWKREASEYINANTGKKCSELKNIPDIVKMFSMKLQDGSTKGPNDICFSTQPLRYVYARSGEFDKWVEEERKYYESGVDQYAPYSQLEWLDVLLAAGHYREAEKFFPEFVNIAVPQLSKEEVVQRVKSGEGPPEFLSRSIIVEPWAKILTIKNKPDDYRKAYRDKEKNMEISERMHRNFYSKDDKKRESALEFYNKNKVKFMIEKAHKTWKGETKTKADKYLEELQKSTTAQ